ncbi:MvdC/MvdD family ATP grasp protein [Streptomyces adelaidensis]|uniref:MvdC/MvdD family ATP grasp protein n=1 Tax=Streptomyces adelaidensis TaxID=2796465 RepID=UPI00190710DD|nr:hypothetical protein [Streptomyces adelaidensis]
MIAADDDWPTDRVVTELTGRAVEVFRMDTVDFPQRLSLAARLDGEHPWAGELATAHRAVDLSRVGAVYYRAPGAFQFPDGMTGPEERFAAAQARAGLGGVLSALDCRWVNHPTFMARAEYKPVQLDAARACGLRIPPLAVRPHRAGAVHGGGGGRHEAGLPVGGHQLSTSRRTPIPSPAGTLYLGRRAWYWACMIEPSLTESS